MACCDGTFTDVMKCFAYKMTLVSAPELIYTLFASRDTVPIGQGNCYRTRLYHNKPPATVPLNRCCETPAPCKTTTSDTEFTTSRYACWEPICLINEIHSRNPDLNMRAYLDGRQMKDTEDSLTLDLLNSIPGVINETGGENGDIPTEPTITGIETIEGLLDENLAQYMYDRIDARNLTGTCPVGESYMGAGHLKIKPSFTALRGFEKKKCYPDQSCIRRSEAGYISQTRFSFANKGIVEKGASAKGQDVYTVFIGGLAAVSIVDLAGHPPIFGYNAPTDVLQECASTFWKINWGGTVNPEQHVFKYRVTKKAA